MAATGELKARIQLLQAAVARGQATGKALKPEIQAELDSYEKQGLIGNSGGSGNGGKPLPAWATKPYEESIAQYGDLKGSLNSFKDEFAGNTVTGGLESSIQGLYSGFGSKGQRDWWADFKAADNQIRNKLFGSALTDTEKKAYESTTITPSMDPAEVRKNLARRAEVVRAALARKSDFLRKQGYKADAIDALAGEYAPDFNPALTDQAKGGDPDSGTAGAAAGGSSAPPSGPTPPVGPDSRGAVQFNDEGPQLATGVSELAPEAQERLYQFSLTKPTAQQLKQYYDTLGAGTLPDANAQQIADYYAKGGTERIGVNYDKAKVTPIDPGDGSVGAFARGVASNVPFSREIAAGIETFADNTFSDGRSSYQQNLDEENGKRAFVEQNNGTAYTLGAVAGSLPFGGVEFMGARQAASAAGRAAVRAGRGAEARVIANRVFASRTAAEAAAQAGVYGVGNADGSAVDRLATGAASAGLGAVTGGAGALAGGRFARALAARRAARVAARPASNDAYRRAAAAGEPGNEAAQMLALAQQQGIRVLPQDIAEGPMVGRMTAGAAQSPFGTNTIRSATDDLYNSFSRRVGEVGGEAGSAPDVGGTVKARSAELAAREAQRAEATSGAVLREAGDAQDVTGAGIVAQRGATRWMEQTAERANALYARVPIQPEAPAALIGTRAALRELNEGMRSNPELGALFSNPRLQALERAVTDDVDPNTREVLREARLSWQDLQEFRTRVGDALDDPRLSEKIASRQLRRLYGALSDDMRATAEAQGPDALRAWRRANDYYDGRMKRVNQTLAAVLGERRDRTPSEAMNALNGMLREGSTGDAARFSRVLRSMEPEDARVVRATIVQEVRGGRRFDAKELASNWERLSERGKSALLPQAGLRNIMDDAADRAVASQRDPLAAKSGEQVVSALEAMAKSTGDSVAFRRQLAALSPDEAQSVRALLVNRMGLTKADAVRQGDGGEVFSISHFLSTWEKMTPEAKLALFGSGEMRSNMNALATLAKQVSKSEALRGHSNTGAVNSLNATTGGLGAAAVALMTGHPIVAAGLAAPAAYQRVSAEALTSQRLLNWLAKAPKKPNLSAQRAHIRSLSGVARAEPAIANEVLSLQGRLADAFGVAPARLAADERPDHRASVEGQSGNGQSAYQGFQP